MPFTVAHPLAVLPFVRWRVLDTTCLVIGAMAPDFEYFARGEQVSTISHTLLGLVVWNLPVTLLLAFAWHRWVKQAVLLVAPVGFARRAAPRFARPPGPLLACAVSALLGAATHILLDGITHGSGFGPRTWPWLLQVYEVPIVGKLGLYRIIQHTCTIVGLAGLTIASVHALRAQAPTTVPDVPRWRARLVFAAAILAGIVLVTGRVIFLLHQTDIGDLIVGVLAGTFAGTLVASLIMRRTAIVLA